ncbi:MAG: hypothetical protein KGL10_01920 [Alphaproteobacteria bacterium]|nr:hypothetical protein [Alphaproteobacteria bacterium]MDE2336045.1 hypothetical protein [Alphaproteobacteria bacterium]
MTALLSNSDVIFILMSVGFYGLIYEAAMPGGILPGITGAICLMLWIFALNGMPVNYAGVLLMVLGIGGMTAEAFFKSRGFLAFAGALCFAAGGKIFIPAGAPAHPVSLWLVGGMTLVSLVVLSLGLKTALRTRKRAVSTGAEGLRGTAGEVVSWSGAKGEVRAAGSVWKARSETAYALEKGVRVKIRDIDGLCLIIEPATKE